MRLKGKNALITGAGSGIGRASAVRFAKEGARILVCDINREPGGAVVDEIRAGGGEADYVHADVTSPADNEKAVEACVRRFGSIDILFCNAGVTVPKELQDHSIEEIDWVLDVNLRGVMYASRSAIPHMLDQGRGNILITSSKTGLVAQPLAPVYCASKGAVILLARALALDYATRGIRVNALCPGIIDTPLLRSVADMMPDPDASWKEWSEAQPMGRLGTTEEVADAAVWLASDEASFVTGVALPIDGGFTAM